MDRSSSSSNPPYSDLRVLRVVGMCPRQLFTIPPKPGASELPSPNALQNKILVKGKTLDASASSSTSADPSAPSLEDDSDDEDDVPKLSATDAEVSSEPGRPQRRAGATQS